MNPVKKCLENLYNQDHFCRYLLYNGLNSGMFACIEKQTFLEAHGNALLSLLTERQGSDKGSESFYSNCLQYRSILLNARCIPMLVYMMNIYDMYYNTACSWFWLSKELCQFLDLSVYNDKWQKIWFNKSRLKLWFRLQRQPSQVIPSRHALLVKFYILCIWKKCYKDATTVSKMLQAVIVGCGLLPYYTKRELLVFNWSLDFKIVLIFICICIPRGKILLCCWTSTEEHFIFGPFMFS